MLEERVAKLEERVAELEAIVRFPYRILGVAVAAGIVAGFCVGYFMGRKRGVYEEREES